MTTNATSIGRALWLGLGLAAGLSASPQDGISWVDGFKEAKAEAHRTGKPIFLVVR